MPSDIPKTTVPDDVVTRCGTCSHYSEDDDGDGRGCCAVMLNDPAAVDWRPRPIDGCKPESNWAWSGLR